MSTIEEIIKMHNPTTASESKSILREIIQSRQLKQYLLQAKSF